MPPTYNCHIAIDNETTHHVRYDKQELKHGLMEQEPVKDIPPNAPNTVAFVARGHHLPRISGCAGSVWYHIGEDANDTIKISYSVRAIPGSKNEVTAESSNKRFATTLAGLSAERSGNTESCIVTVTEARR